MDAPPIPENQNAPESEPSSLFGRLTNVYAAPGEAFDDIVGKPVIAVNWLVPTLLACLAAIIFIIVAFSQESVVREVRAISEKGIQAKVDAGQMKQADADRSIEFLEKILNPTVLRITGSLGAIVGIFSMLFLNALLLWLAATFWVKKPIEYLKMVEFNGLPLMILALQGVVKTFLVVWKGSMLATIGPALLVEDLSMTNRQHVALASIDIVDFWWIGLIGLAFSKATGVKWWKSTGVALVVFYGFKFISVGLGALTKSS